MSLFTLKEERISIRATVETKNLIHTAAAISNVSVTDFLINAAQRAAEQVIAESESVILNNGERDRFLELLNHPPEPNEGLKKAMARHKKHL